MTDLASPETPILLQPRHWSHAIPREPTSAMLSAPVHMALGFWSNNWEVEEGVKVIHWAIVVDDDRTGVRVSTSTSREARPMPTILADIYSNIATVQGAFWFVLPKRHVLLASRLHTEGVPVTRGLMDENRARATLIDTIHTRHQMQEVAAKTNGSFSENPEIKTATPRPSGSRSATRPPVLLWWPDIRRLRNCEQREMTIGTDASSDRFGGTGIGVISSRGDVFARSYRTQGNIGEVELDAITLALELLAHTEVRRATILSDNVDAVTVAQAMLRRRSPESGYRGISTASRVRFLRARNYLDCTLEVSHARAHSGVILNEAADRLSAMVRLAAMQPQESIEASLNRDIRIISEAVRDSKEALNISHDCHPRPPKDVSCRAEAAEAANVVDTHRLAHVVAPVGTHPVDIDRRGYFKPLDTTEFALRPQPASFPLVFQ